MEISPGVEFTWSLANLEAAGLKNREVIPEHFFCALLKFSEFTNQDLMQIRMPPMALFQMIAEREQVSSLLAAQKIDPKARRAVRSGLSKGDYATDGREALHRSEAARQVFEKAAARAKKWLDAPLLLETLLAHPMPAVSAALGKTFQAQTPQVERAPRPFQKAASPTPAPPAAATPQLQVLSAALAATHKLPLLLVCDPQVSLDALLAAANLPAGSQSIDLAAAWKSEQDFSSIFEEQLREDNLLLHLDAREIGALSDCLTALAQVHRHRPQPIVLSVSSRTFSNEVPGREAFRILWLHDLSTLRIPERV